MTGDNGLKLFCIGLGVGAATAYFLAPKSGRDSRQFLRDKAGEGADYVKKQTQEVADHAHDILERSAKAVRYRAESVKAAVDAGSRAYREAVATSSENNYRV